MAVFSSAVATPYARDQLHNAPVPARVLGSFGTACYLQLASGGVLAVLTEDAVQLPIGVTLPWHSSQLPLTEFGPGTPVSCTAGQISLGRLTVTIAGERPTALAYAGTPTIDHGVPPGLNRIAELPGRSAALFTDPGPAVHRLIGLGPGLTPAGDDLICGALAGARLFGLPGSDLARAVQAALAESERRTTSLSAELLRRAVAGEGVPQLQHLATAMCTADRAAVADAWRHLLRIGHSSGAALGLGLIEAAQQLRCTRRTAAPGHAETAA